MSLPTKPTAPSLDGLSETIADLYRELEEVSSQGGDGDKPQGLFELIMKIYRDLEASKPQSADNNQSAE